MKIYKYWALEKQSILIDGAEQQITCYGESNTSIEAAHRRAKEKDIVRLQDEITGANFRQPLA